MRGNDQPNIRQRAKDAGTVLETFRAHHTLPQSGVNVLGKTGTSIENPIED